MWNQLRKTMKGKKVHSLTGLIGVYLLGGPGEALTAIGAMDPEAVEVLLGGSFIASLRAAADNVADRVGDRVAMNSPPEMPAREPEPAPHANGGPSQLAVIFLVLGLTLSATAASAWRVLDAEIWNMENPIVESEAVEVKGAPGWLRMVVRLPGHLGGYHSIYCPPGEVAARCAMLEVDCKIDSMGGFFTNMPQLDQKVPRNPRTALVLGYKRSEKLQSSCVKKADRRQPGRRHVHPQGN